MNKNKMTDSNSFDAERVIHTPEGKELMSTEMVHKKNVEAAALELKEISTDESVQMIHKIDDYCIKLDRDEARIKYERDLLGRKRDEFIAVRDAKYGRIKPNFSEEFNTRLGDFAERFSFKALLRPIGIVAAIIGIIWIANLGFKAQEAVADASTGVSVEDQALKA